MFGPELRARPEESSLRLFIASFFGPQFIERLGALARAAVRGGDRVRWVRPEACHLTYAFLGERPGYGAEAAALEAALEGQRAFRLVSGPLGGFPGLERPKVLWLSLARGAGEASEVAARVSPLLPQTERRAFAPHITLGRVVGELPSGCVRDLAAAVEAAPPATSEVSSVALVRSTLTGTGPVYETVFFKKLL